ncbi:MAG: hypothetical protein P8Z30_12730 [Acidobacteriota bacterium]
MSNLIITFVTLLTAGVLLVNQRASLGRVRDANRQLVSQIGVLHSRADDLTKRRVRLQRRLSDAQNLLAAAGMKSVAVPQKPSEAIVPPDPTRHGGWPARVPYFYLPKKDLDSVGYRLFENNRLTDGAATLFGMTTGEREAVDAAYDDLWRKFRELEIEQMKPMALPNDWEALPERSPWRLLITPYLWKQAKANGCIAYYLPSLEKESAALSNEFASTLEQTLGTVRAGCLLGSANDYIATRLGNLGRKARCVGFIKVLQPDGKKQFVYAIENVGINGSTKAIQSPLDPDSEEAYYAQLFGVDVPIEHNSSDAGAQN